MKLELGKCYQTESGEWVGPMKPWTRNEYIGKVIGRNKIYYVNDGRMKYPEQGLHLKLLQEEITFDELHRLFS